MLKSFTVILLSCLLTLSIFSPSVMSLTNVDCTVVVNDFEDEDKEIEDKEIEDTDIEDTDIEEENEERFFQSLIILNDFFTINHNIASVLVIDSFSIYSLDIKLPPPEYTI